MNVHALQRHSDWFFQLSLIPTIEALTDTDVEGRSLLEHGADLSAVTPIRTFPKLDELRDRESASHE